MSLLRMVLWFLVLAAMLPAVAHAATAASMGASTHVAAAGAIARDWAPCFLALAALAFRVRRFSRRAR